MSAAVASQRQISRGSASAICFPCDFCVPMVIVFTGRRLLSVREVTLTTTRFL